MKQFPLFILAFLLGSLPVLAQNQLTYKPEKPKAGESITVTYTFANDPGKAKVEGVVYIKGEKDKDLNSLPLTKKGKTYTGTFTTKSTDNLAIVGIKTDDVFDTNEGEGYLIPLYEGDDVKNGVDLAAATFYLAEGSLVGIDSDNSAKALELMNEAFEKNPDEKVKNLVQYTQLQVKNNKEDAEKIYQSAIEQLLKSGLEKETDYATLEMLYNLAKLPQQMAFVSKVKKEKFPDGNWKVSDQFRAFMQEKDLDKKENLLGEFKSAYDKSDNKEQMAGAFDYMMTSLFNEYAKSKSWDKIESAVKKYYLKGINLARIYNSLAWQLQEKNEDLDQAAKFAEEGLRIAKAERANPTEEKPYYSTVADWEKSRDRMVGIIGDTYAMVQYKLGNYQKGYDVAKQAAIDINEGKSADYNSTYALLAQKVVPAKTLVPQLSNFVKEGAADSAVVAILESAYNESNKKGGWDQYYAGLQQEARKKMMADLAKKMINDPSPKFALYDLDGQQVNVDDLKNKVVIVDFWATWCGPCKASFPGMEKMVQKYKADPNVKFLFVNTWEDIEDQNEKKQTLTKFITDNKYNFHVLLDNDNKVVESFGVSGIPTKFVIDGKGNIRFKSVGYSGSDDALIDELTGMIELAKKG